MRTQELAQAQYEENRALAVLHFEQRRVAAARAAYDAAFSGMMQAEAKYEQAKSGREALDRPEAP